MFPSFRHIFSRQNEAATIVTWTSTGTAFGILDNTAFANDVLSSYFKRECPTGWVQEGDMGPRVLCVWRMGGRDARVFVVLVHFYLFAIIRISAARSRKEGKVL